MVGKQEREDAAAHRVRGAGNDRHASQAGAEAMALELSACEPAAFLDGGAQAAFERLSRALVATCPVASRREHQGLMANWNALEAVHGVRIDPMRWLATGAGGHG